MKIETKFDLGQKVFLIKYDSKPIRKPCDKCGGVVEYETPTGVKVKCDKCRYAEYQGHPKGTMGSFLDSEWYIVGTGTIGRVCATRCDYNGGDPDALGMNYQPQKPDSDKEEYMLWETGIGSGTLHSPDKMFATEEDAQRECDLRNTTQTQEG